MPRKNPVPEREKQICRRLRLFRKETRLSQVAFANEVGLDSTVLASYEHGRVPLRYATADTICRMFDLSQRWLAMGLEPKQPYISITKPLAEQVGPRMLFSDAYDQFLECNLAGKLASFKELKDEGYSIAEMKKWVTPAIKGQNLESAVGVNMLPVASTLAEVPPRLYAVFFRELTELKNRFLAIHSDEIAAFKKIKTKKKGA